MVACGASRSAGDGQQRCRMLRSAVSSPPLDGSTLCEGCWREDAGSRNGLHASGTDTCNRRTSVALSSWRTAECTSCPGCAGMHSKRRAYGCMHGALLRIPSPHYRLQSIGMNAFITSLIATVHTPHSTLQTLSVHRYQYSLSTARPASSVPVSLARSSVPLVDAAASASV